ncbi:MAG: nifR3-like protein [Chloroflexi bacterium]|nr:MAG: nifR3-like protein [Chloroflexota bacterium]MBA4376018.1 tRNA dihydrouridine synthase DusB [Anaerolinea sp.]
MINHTSPSFFIGNIPITGRLILAPMDGYTDSPFRSIARKFGSSYCVSEFINGIDIAHGHPHLSNKLTFSDCERPFAFQIFDDSPDRMLNAARILQRRVPDFIDLNMGCSARNVSNRGAGAGLLKDPKKIGRIVESIVKALDIPITAKIRLGWDETTLNYIEVSRILQESGASLISVHARTRRQEYSGSANWSAIGEIKNSVHIPVIGNGDVKSVEDAKHMMSQTGCDAVMIGRAAIGNPWIFAGTQRDEQTEEERFRVLQEHVDAMVNEYGSKIGVVLFRKHLTRYLSGYLVTSEIRQEIYSIEDREQLLDNVRYRLSLTKL